MKRMIVILAAALAAGFYLGTPAQATTGHGPSFATCDNLKGWYANPDEQGDLPTPTAAGLLFEGKDLVHHQTSAIDLADMDKVAYSFTATNAGKVVFKVETTAPYSTIVTNADGKIWSTAMTYDQDGGQGHPVEKYSELVGKPTKPGKAPYTSASAVATFGIGYWVAEGDTVVSQIKFHGHTYDLTCPPPVTTAPTTTPATTAPTTAPTTTPATTAPTTEPVTSRPTTAPTTSGGSEPSPSGSVSPSRTAGALPTTTNVSDGSDSLPVTGPSMGLLIGIGLVLIAGGGTALVLSTRRRNSFKV